MPEAKTVKSAPVPPPPPSAEVQALEDGFRQIVLNKNPGYANAFLFRPEEKIRLTAADLLRICDSLEIVVPNRHLPDDLEISVKFSPIALFKKWIFTVSNKNFLKVTEREKEFEREFYIFFYQDFVCFQSVTTNIAHEKFLLTVFEKKEIRDFTAEFKTYFTTEKKIVLFKDYLNRKTSSVKLSQNLLPKRFYDVKVSVTKDSKSIRFKIWVNHGAPISQMIKFSKQKRAEEKNTKAPQGKESQGAEASFKSSEDYRKEVIELLQSLDKGKKKTNKFANISLGRVNKIPLLINLASKYKDAPIKLHFTRNQELVILDSKEMEIKTFTVAKNPKSNWLEKR